MVNAALRGWKLWCAAKAWTVVHKVLHYVPILLGKGLRVSRVLKYLLAKFMLVRYT
jgi:hypothetical protein